LNIRW